MNYMNFIKKPEFLGLLITTILLVWAAADIFEHWPRRR